MSAASPRPSAAVALTGAWALALAMLAVLWIRSPFTGPGPMFLVWSALGVPLTLWSARLFRQWGIRQLPRGRRWLVVLGGAWAVAAWLSASSLPGIWAMDGEILRRAALHVLGTALQWLPGLFGLGVSVAGLSAGLEARYRLVRGDVATHAGAASPQDSAPPG